MNVTPRKREQIMIRRAAVARYKALGYGLSAIVNALAEDGIRPTNREKRWGPRIIQKDVNYLKERYVLDADSDIAKWLDAELEVMNYALAAAMQGVADKAKVVVGYQHVQKRDPATGSLQEIKNPVFETVENLAAIDRVVKVAESRRKLLALDRLKRDDAPSTGFAEMMTLLQQNPAMVRALLSAVDTPAASE